MSQTNKNREVRPKYSTRWKTKQEKYLNQQRAGLFSPCDGLWPEFQFKQDASIAVRPLSDDEDQVLVRAPIDALFCYQLAAAKKEIDCDRLECSSDRLPASPIRISHIFSAGFIPDGHVRKKIIQWILQTSGRACHISRLYSHYTWSVCS